MDGLPSSFGIVGLAVGVLSAVFAYINRDRYKTLINDIYKPGNQELREQLASARAENVVLLSEKTALEAQRKETEDHIKDLKDLNSRLPDYAALTTATNKVITTMSDNHTATMGALTTLATKIEARSKRPKK